MSGLPSTDSRTSAQRSAILEAAVEQIALKGYDGVRLRDIARAAGVSIGLLQHHFGTRDALLGEAFEHHCAQLLDGWQELVSRRHDPWERIVALVDRLARSPLLSQRAIVWADFCASSARWPDLRPHLRRIYAEWRALVAETVQEGIERQMFRPRLPIDRVVDLLIAQIDGALLAVAGDVGYMNGTRLHELMVSSAGVLLDHITDTDTDTATVEPVIARRPERQ